MADFVIAGVLKCQLLRIRKLLIVVEEIFASRSGNQSRVSFDAEPPQGVVKFVDAVISQVAATEVVPPVPVVMKAIRLKRHEFGGTYPCIVVHILRRRRRLLVTDIISQLPVPAFRNQYVAYQPIVEHLDRLLYRCVGSRLCAMTTALPLLFAASKSNCPSRTFVAAGLLDIHVFPCLQGQEATGVCQ